MPGYFEYIDAYFNQTLSHQEVERFEQKLTEDKAFAEDVAFYLSAKQVVIEQREKEKKDWFKQLLPGQDSIIETQKNARLKTLWIYRSLAAAAIFVVLAVSWYLFYSK